jgi:hypothetical protein
VELEETAVARQQLDKHLSSETDAHETEETVGNVVSYAICEKAIQQKPSVRNGGQGCSWSGVKAE